MLRIKGKTQRHIVALLLLSVAMMLAGCDQEREEVSDAQILVIQEQGTEEQVYETDIVTRGDFVRTSNFDGVLFYPEMESVTYEGGQAVLTEWLVQEGDRVAKGDPVAHIQIEYDAVALEEMELVLERLQSEYGWQKKQMDADIARKKAAWEQDGLRRSELEYQRAEASLELYMLSMEQSIKAQEESIEQFREQISVSAIVAPVDGVVSELSYLKSGEYVPQGQSLMVLYDPDVMWLRVTDISATLRYNMEVKIETGQAKRRTVLSGRVVAADNILQDSLRRGVSYIEITDVPENVQWSNTSVKADMVEIEQVLLVDRMAVESEDGSSFVYLLEDGVLRKRQVIRAGQGVEACWILMGLEEGQEVVISR